MSEQRQTAIRPPCDILHELRQNWAVAGANERIQGLVLQEAARHIPVLSQMQHAGVMTAQIRATLDSVLTMPDQEALTFIRDPRRPQIAIPEEEIPEAGPLADHSFEHKDVYTWLEACADLHITFRYNSRANRHEMSRQGETWQACGDAETSLLTTWLARRYHYVAPGMAKSKPFHFTDNELKHAMLSIRAPAMGMRVDPFEEWLLALPEWDGTPRLEGLLSHVFHAPDTALNRWASRFMCVGPIVRTLHPDSLIRTMPVLHGQQGAGKSAFFKGLLPPQRHAQKWFTDSYDLHDEKQRRVESTLGAVIVEIAEMSGMKRAEIEKVKSQVSATDDKLRLPYDVSPSQIPRTFIFVGSTNDDRVLPDDPSGNTRFVVVQTQEPDDGVEEFFVQAQSNGESFRTQLWAEAMQYYRRQKEELIPQTLSDDPTVYGRIADLPRNLRAEQAALNESYQDRDDLVEENIDTAIQQVLQVEGAILCTTAITEKTSLLAGSSITKNRITRAMQRRGYENRKSNGEWSWRLKSA